MGALIIFAVVILGGIPLVYFIAHQKQKQIENDKQDYRILTTNFNELTDSVRFEADQWPIFARPILFDDVDHETQVIFAQTHKSVDTASELVDNLEEVKKRQLQKPSLLTIPDNMSVIKTSGEFRSFINAFAEQIIQLARSITAIKDNQKKIEQKRLMVRQGIANLQLEITKSNNLVNGLSAEEDVSRQITNILWAIQYAQNAHTSAQGELDRVVDEQLDDDQGDLRYAIANVYVTIGKIALKCFKLYVDSLKEWDRYELDMFMEHYQGTTKQLERILEIEDISGWKKLRRAKEPIDAFPEKEKKAQESLDDFRRKRADFESAEISLKGIEWEKKTETARDVQGKCGRYWRPYHESKDNWQAILGGRLLPEDQLTQLHDLYISDILPFTGAGKMIKQSSLPALSGAIRRMLSNIESIDKDIEHLFYAYQQNLGAENEVRNLISRGGQVFIAIENIKMIIGDSDIDLENATYTSIENYKGYIARVKQVVGANFPELLGQCKELITTCNLIVQTHQARLAEHKTKYRSLSTAMQRVANMLESFITHSPAFETQYLSRLEQLYGQCNSILKLPLDGKYLTFKSLVTQMENWISITNPFIEKTKMKVYDFGSLCGRTQNEFIKAKATIENYRLHIERYDGWARDEMISILERGDHSLRGLFGSWEREKELKWQGITIQEAEKDCHRNMRSIDEIMTILETDLIQKKHEYGEFRKWSAEIERIAIENRLHIPDSDFALITNLRRIGLRAPTRDFSRRTLELAEELATKRITEKVRRSAVMIIEQYNVYTQGGAHIGGGVNISGQGQFVGRDYHGG